MSDRTYAGGAGGGAGQAWPTIEPIGDAALLVTFSLVVVPATAARAQAAAADLEAIRPEQPAFGRPIPAHASVLVPFDPLAIDLDEAIAVVARVLANAAQAPAGAIGDSADLDAWPIEIPVRYGGADGPDLEAVADLHGIRPADVIDIHAAGRYQVVFLGFAPGFGYLGGLAAALVTPRRASPRERVPAGSVAIAGEQTAVYPVPMPGGWQLIGRTDAVLFDPTRNPPALLRPGATVRFVPVTDR